MGTALILTIINRESVLYKMNKSILLLSLLSTTVAAENVNMYIGGVYDCETEAIAGVMDGIPGKFGKNPNVTDWILKTKQGKLTFANNKVTIKYGYGGLEEKGFHGTDHTWVATLDGMLSINVVKNRPHFTVSYFGGKDRDGKQNAYIMQGTCYKR